MRPRQSRGLAAYDAGLRAEQRVIALLIQDGWTILGQRLRTGAGEIDIAAERDGLLAVVEVKRRPDLATAAHALSTRQSARLLAATEALLAAHPDWGRAGIRIDLMLVDAECRVRRITDAIRLE